MTKTQKSTLIPNSFTLLFVLLAILVCNILVADYIQDDGYITFHYAKNLSDHGSLYYNLGETGPYGYSNPAYLFLLAGLRLLTLKLVSFEALSRVIASLALGVILFFLPTALRSTISGKRRRTPALLALFTVYIITFFPYFLPNFFSGLETALFTLLVFLILAALFEVVPLSEGWLTVALALALTIRIDAAFVLLPILGQYLLTAGEKRGARIRRLILIGVLALLLQAAQYALTNTWLPLSFGHKKSAFALGTFLAYLKFAALTLTPLLLFTFARRGRLALFIIFQTLYAALFYSFFVHWHFERYLFPFVFASFTVLLLALIQSWRRGDGLRLALLSAYWLLLMPITLQGYAFVSGYRVTMRNRELIAQAFEDAQLPPQDRTFASYDAGYIPYHSNWKIIDLLGLTTPEVLGQDIESVIVEENPTVLIVSTFESMNPDRVRLWSQYQTEEVPIPANYQFIKSLHLTNPYFQPELDYNYYIFVNERANATLTAGLTGISIDPEKVIGYQKYVYRFLERIKLP